MNTLAHRGTHCGCPKCMAGQRERMIDRLTRDSFQIAVRHAQEQPESWAPEARPSGFPDLPRKLQHTSFTLEWTDPISIRKVLGEDKRPPPPPASFMQLFDSQKESLIYAVLRKGTLKPLYIGMVPGSTTTMRSRLIRHLAPPPKKKSPTIAGPIKSSAGKTRTPRPLSATRQLKDELRDHTDLYLALAKYTVPDPPYRKNANMTRVIEGLVQETMRPRYWNPDVWTFEDEEDAAELAELLEGEL